MSEIQIKQGNVIYEKDQAVTMLSIIMEGTVSARLADASVKLTVGDVIGVTDLYTNVHSCTYTAETDIVVDSYPYKSIENLQKILQEDDTFSQCFARSTLKQFFALADFCNMHSSLCDSIYSTLMEYHREYTKLCKQYQVPAKNLPGLEMIQPFVVNSRPDDYVWSYYKDLQKVAEDPNTYTIFEKNGFLSGFLMRASQDMHQYLNTCEEMTEYLTHLTGLLINEEKIDFLDLYTSLLTSVAHKGNDIVSLMGIISKMFIRTKTLHSLPPHLYQQRFTEYRELAQELNQVTGRQQDSFASSAQADQITGKLKNSLAMLLSYAGMDEAFRESFTDDVIAYKKIVDKTSVSSELSALRKRLTQGFFDLYKNTFFVTLKQPVPEVVKMFLYFGYVDEELCGIENAIHLYELLSTYHSDESAQIYLFYDWLNLIYKGQKQPRRDEFDQDYPAYVQTMVNDGSISKAHAAELLNDATKKVEFELDNMFMTAVKMTYGRLQTYCPLLSEHDFIKTPAESILRPHKLKGAFAKLLEIDFSAFYRETMFADTSLPGGREIVQREILPDIILLPNIGIRAALWQEIEGRNRCTPGCMLFPTFCLTDISHLAMRLVGEFRWEMCKRVQGSRWNDVSNLSLTSEYFDYLQFYKKNKDLSTEAKEKCRQQLARVKNRFREAFILDYIAWITYEAKGTPHMNKVTRKIFMTYCPFSASYRETLSKNPFYASLLEKYDNQKTKELTRMNSVIYRIKRNGKSIPAELEQQLAFLQK